MYATRRIKDAFRENKDISDPEKIKVLVKKAQDGLEIMKRQVWIYNKVSSKFSYYSNLSGPIFTIFYCKFK